MAGDTRETFTITDTSTASDTGPAVSGVCERQRLGPYRVERLLGRGGMGAVFLATDERYDAQVALKLVPGDFDDVRLRALKREYRLMSDFGHPNVVQMYGLRASESGWFCVMEFVDGTEFLPFFWGRAADGERDGRGLAALRQLAAGLAALHDGGWVHRDIKSSNVMVERGTDRAVILDFGLIEGGPRDVAAGDGPALGTPSYMAPELLNGGAAVPASDWYSFGVLLAQCLLGQSAVLQRRAGLVERLASLEGGPDGRLLSLARRLLEVDPSLRPTAAQVFEAFEMRLPTPVPARPAGSLEGRADEAARLRRAWDEVRNGGVRVVEIEGEGGVGKTALATALMDEIEDARAAHVVRSRCHADEQIPFKATDRLIEQLAALARARLASGNAEAPQDDDADRVAALDLGLRALGGAVREDLPAAEAQRRLDVFARVRRVVHAISAARPLVFFVDDVHWGDADSAQLLQAILEPDASRTSRVLVVWTTRPGCEATPFLAEARRCRLREGVAYERVALAGLDVAAAERLAARILGADDVGRARAIAVETGGNPLLVEKASRRARVGTQAASPSSLLEELIDAELCDAAPASRDLLNVLAIARAPLATEVAAAAAGASLDVYRTVAALRRAKLVSVSAEADGAAGEHIELEHDQLRAPVLRTIAALAKTDLHRALARSLEAAHTSDAGLVAEHYHEAGDARAAAEHAERAADGAASALAFLSAAEHYRHAMGWAERSPAELQKLEVKLAGALFNAGRCHDAARAYETARRRAGDRAPRDLALHETTAWLAAGHIDRAFETIGPILQEERMSAPSARLLLPVLGAKLAWARLRLPRVLARPPRYDERRARRADICWAMGQGTSMFLSGTGAFFGVQSLIEALASGDGQRIGRALAFVGGICAVMGGRAAGWGEECLARAEAFAEEHSDAYLRGWCDVWRANTHLVGGRFERAIEQAEHGVALIERGPYKMSWECHTARCFALMARERAGDLEGVARVARTVLGAARVQEDLYGQVVFSLFIAYGELAAGRVDAACDLARDAVARFTRDAFTIQHFYGLRIETYADLYRGRPEAARQRLESAWAVIARSDVQGIPSARADAFVLRAHVSLAVAAQRRSPALLRRARRCARAIAAQSREAAAHAELLLASVAMVTGDAREAARRAWSAAGGFERLGMRIWASMARRGALSAEGRVGAREAEERTLEALNVADPACWSRAMAPGF